MVYQEGLAKVKIGMIASILLALFLPVSLYFGAAWPILAMSLCFFGIPPALGYALGGFISMRRAKRLLIHWWR